MDKYTATEQAYKNGYERGYNDGKKEAEDEILILKQKRANMFEILDAYERGMDNALKWIPVGERLPNKWGSAIVYRKGEHYSMLRYTPALGWHFYDSEWGDVTVDDVTHWMPLPEPPKEV